VIRLLPIVLALALSTTARAQVLDIDAPPPWQPSWRFVSGAVALGGGAALLSLSFAYGQRVLAIEDRALAASRAADGAATDAQLIRLRNRIDSLNHQGSDLETRHLVTLASGSVLFATGLAFVIWDWLRAPDPFRLTVSPLPSGVAVRLDW
jgi:hypothetical protein